MTGLSLGLVIEGAVAILLATTIGYCIILNRKLKNLHADRAALQQMIGDLVQATEMANHAIKGLKQTAVETNEQLNQGLSDAERFAIELANHVNAGQSVLERISKITQAARNGDDMPSAKRAQTALEALNEHRRRRETESAA